VIRAILAMTPWFVSLLHPRPPVAITHGTATWYSNGPGIYAAAGPALRHGHWRGRSVQVCTHSRCLTVRLTDWCRCGGGRVIDLSPAAFARLAPLSRGTVRVEVRD
jgi:hypothetical protein